jgi:hypothetical protein
MLYEVLLLPVITHHSALLLLMHITVYKLNSWFNDDSSFLLDDDWVLEGQQTNAKPVYKRTFKDHETKHRERVRSNST